MNIFKYYEQLFKKIIKANTNLLGVNNTSSIKNLTVETPPPNYNFDISSNAAMILAKENKLNPKLVAEKLIKILKENVNEFEQITIEGPGFLNFKLNDKKKLEFIETILTLEDNFGKLQRNSKINLEYVSANPTGPLHVGHCRGAIFGDVLANILSFCGFQVTREYYVNDYGNQIFNFVNSIFYRIKEIKDKSPFPKQPDLYPGEYIIDIAKKIVELDKANINLDIKKDFNKLKDLSLRFSLDLIKKDLADLNIVHNNFVSETKLVEEKLVDKTIQFLTKKELVKNDFLDPPKGEEKKNWKKIKRLVFKSSLFGDDTDRALTKDDGSWTYFASDIAYHYDKILRNPDQLINILGADHAGYIKRISSAVSALSEKKLELVCKICQLVKLYKDGKPFKMSKRAGDFITAQDLLNEVSVDNIRFIMLSRSNDVEIEFDFKKVIEKNKDNHVYYIQYANARINSVLNQSNHKMNDKIDLINSKVEFNDYDKAIIKKIFEWPKIIETSATKLEPHKIPYYLYDLANLFHSYWTAGAKNPKYKFNQENSITPNALISIILVKNVIKLGMNLLGVSLPKKM